MKVTADVRVDPKVKVPVGALVANTAGATGVSIGVTEADAADADEVPPVAPEVLIAVEVNVYATPFVRPLTTQDPLAPVTVQVFVTPPTCGEAVTVYEVGAPPVFPAVTVTVAFVSPAIAVGAGGVPGGVMLVELFVTDCAVNVAASFPTES